MPSFLDYYFTLQRDQLHDTPTAVISTDMEPGDIVAILTFLQQAQQNPDLTGQLQLCFLVGEGHSGKKYLRMQRMIEQLKETGLLDESKIKIEIIQGFGSQKQFEQEGLEYYDSIADIDRALDKAHLTDGLDEKTQQAALKKLITFMKRSNNPLILGLKPPREFLALFHNDSQSLKAASYIGTFSFNMRTIISEESKKLESDGIPPEEAQKTAQQNMQAFLANAFSERLKAPICYESFFALGSKNSYDETHQPAIFEQIINADNPVMEALRKLIKLWNAHILGNDPKDVAVYGTSPENKAKVKEIMQDNWTTEQEAELRKLIFLPNEKIEQAVERKIKKWENITSAGAQFVAADAALMATITTDNPADTRVRLSCNPCELNYDLAGYTVLSPLSSSSDKNTCCMRVFMPDVKTKEFCMYLSLLAEKTSLESAITNASPEEDTSTKTAALLKIKEHLKPFISIPQDQEASYHACAEVIASSLGKLNASMTEKRALQNRVM